MFESRNESAAPTSTPRALAAAIVDEVRLQSRSRARMLAWIEAFDRARAYKLWGARSTSEWIATHCGLSRMVAREYVRVAVALRRLPALARAFHDGNLSYSRIRAVTRFATPESEADLVAVAMRTRVEDLEDMARLHRKTRAMTDPAFVVRARSVRQGEQDGMTTIVARLAPDEGALVDRVLTAIMDRDRVSAETEPEEWELDPDAAPVWERRRADALVGMARDWLAGRGSGHAEASAPAAEVVAYIDATKGMARLDNGPRIGPKTLERMLCDSVIRRVVALPGRKVDYGRARRTVSPGQRDAVIAMYGGRCQWPGCRVRRGLNVHHVRHWAYDGPTAPENLSPLCPHHHRCVHEGGYELWIDDESSIVRTPAGDILIAPLTRTPMPVVTAEPPGGYAGTGSGEESGRRHESAQAAAPG